MRLYSILFFLFGCSFLASSQIDSSEVNLTPYGVIYNHLYYLQDDSYDADRAALSFPDNVEAPDQLAVQLKRVLDGKGFYVDINRLPQDPNYRDSLSNEDIYFIDKDEARIYVEKQDGKWYYSRTTIAQVPEMFDEVFPLGAGFAQ